jgi:hypothetical protein
MPATEEVPAEGEQPPQEAPPADTATQETPPAEAQQEAPPQEPAEQQPDMMAQMQQKNDDLMAKLSEQIDANKRLIEMLVSQSAQRATDNPAPVTTEAPEEFSTEEFDKGFFDSEKPSEAIQKLVDAKLKQLGLDKLDPSKLQTLDRYEQEQQKNGKIGEIQGWLRGLEAKYPEIGEETNRAEIISALQDMTDKGGLGDISKDVVAELALDVMAKNARAAKSSAKELEDKSGNEDFLYEKVKGSPALMKKIEQEFLKRSQTNAPSTLGVNMSSGQPSYSPQDIPKDEQGRKGFVEKLFKRYSG